MNAELAATQEMDRLDALHAVLDSGSVIKATRMLNALHPAEMAHVLQSLPPQQRKLVWSMVDDGVEGEVLLYLNDDLREELLRGMAPSRILAAAEALDTDDLADLVQDLPATITREVLKSLDEQRRERLETALAFPDGSSSRSAGILVHNRRKKKEKRCWTERRLTAYTVLAVCRGKRTPSASRRVRCASSG
jgi:magnesium transporter